MVATIIIIIIIFIIIESIQIFAIIHDHEKLSLEKYIQAIYLLKISFISETIC